MVSVLLLGAIAAILALGRLPDQQPRDA